MQVIYSLSPHSPRTMIKSPGLACYDGADGVSGEALVPEKNCISNFESRRKRELTIPLLCSIMPTLPSNLAPVRAAVASALLSSNHADSLYGVEDVIFALNIAADVSNSSKVDQTMLLRAFANDAAEKYELQQRSLTPSRGQARTYIRKGKKTGRYEGKQQYLHFGLFSSTEEAKRATIIQ